MSWWYLSSGYIVTVRYWPTAPMIRWHTYDWLTNTFTSMSGWLYTIINMLSYCRINPRVLVLSWPHHRAWRRTCSHAQQKVSYSCDAQPLFHMHIVTPFYSGRLNNVVIDRVVIMQSLFKSTGSFSSSLSLYSFPLSPSNLSYMPSLSLPIVVWLSDVVNGSKKFR